MDEVALIKSVLGDFQDPVPHPRSAEASGVSEMYATTFLGISERMVRNAISSSVTVSRPSDR